MCVCVCVCVCVCERARECMFLICEEYVLTLSILKSFPPLALRYSACVAPLDKLKNKV